MDSAGAWHRPLDFALVEAKDGSGVFVALARGYAYNAERLNNPAFPYVCIKGCESWQS
jgi:hypothetical protein